MPHCMFVKFGFQAAMVIGCIAGCVAAQNSQAKDFTFDFGTRDFSLTNAYSSETGSGLDLKTSATFLPNGGITSTKPFFYSISAPESNYLVTIVFGDPSGATTNYVKAEARRLMAENVITAKGKFATRQFVVNTRTVEYPGGKVHLKPREVTNEVVTWDDKLTLEFSGPHPVLQLLKIQPTTNVTTVFIAGDSTVCDQPLEPWNSWGQMLPRFFDEHVAVANYAESGESIRSSIGAHRFDKIFSVIRPGDFLFVQFGHNDMKDHATNALEVYKSNLKKIVAETRSHGATPVLITSMERRDGIHGPTLMGYPDAVREIAREMGAALIDLNVASLKFYHALGTNLDLAFQDGTHHNNYGSYELARCVVHGIRDNKLDLVKDLAADAAPFDPTKPDDVKAFYMPESPMHDPAAKPEGN